MKEVVRVQVWQGMQCLSGARTARESTQQCSLVQLPAGQRADPKRNQRCHTQQAELRDEAARHCQREWVHVACAGAAATAALTALC